LKDGEKLPLGFTVGLSFHRADAFTNTKDSSHTLARKISPLVCREESKQYAADKSELIMASSSGGPRVSALQIQKDVMWPKCSAVLWRNMYVHLLDVLIYNTLGLILFISGRNSLLNWRHSSMIPPERWSPLITLILEPKSLVFLELVVMPPTWKTFLTFRRLLGTTSMVRPKWSLTVNGWDRHI